MEMTIEVAKIKIEVNEKFFLNMLNDSCPSDIELADMVVDCLVAVYENISNEEDFKKKLKEFLSDADLIDQLREALA